jgi:hypothetical protein
VITDLHAKEISSQHPFNRVHIQNVFAAARDSLKRLAVCGTLRRMTQSITRSFTGRSHNAVIRVYDAAGNVIGARAQGRFQRVVKLQQLKLMPFSPTATAFLSRPR